MQMSAPVSRARDTARWATLAGSDPLAPVTISAPTRSAQMDNCSTAAARNVSPAPNTTFLPWAIHAYASLAIEVVFPEPLTPTTMITVGPAGASAMGFWTCAVSWFNLTRIWANRSAMCTTRPRN